MPSSLSADQRPSSMTAPPISASSTRSRKAISKPRWRFPALSRSTRRRKVSIRCSRNSKKQSRRLIVLDATPADAAKVVPPIAAFGRLRGTIVVGGRRRALDAVARIGASFTGLGPQKFSTRRMLWANFNDGGHCRALEMRTLALDANGRTSNRSNFDAMMVGTNAASRVSTSTSTSPLAPPDRVSGDVTTASGDGSSSTASPRLL